MRRVRRVQPTARGIGLAGMGGLLTIIGVLMGVALMVQVGALLLVTVGVGALWLSQEARVADRGGLRLVRRVTPHPVTVGHSATVEVELMTTAGAHHLERIDIAEQAARELSGPAGLRARVHRSPGLLRLTYRIEPDRRGRWPVGPLNVQRQDLFGVVRWAGPLGSAMRVAVRPTVVRLEVDTRSASTDVDRAALGARMPAADDALLRDYRAGDDLRRVHWRSSARRGELTVRQDERAARRPVSVVLDVPTDRVGAEWSISAAASIALALVRAGHRVRLLGGDVIGATVDHHRPGADGTAADALLDQTVDLRLPPNRTTRDAWLRAAIDTLGAQGGGTELVFAVVGGLEPDVLAGLARVGEGNLGWAMVRCGRDGVEPTEDETSTLESLRRAGWAACAVRPGEDIAVCWHRLLGAEERVEARR